MISHNSRVFENQVASSSSDETAAVDYELQAAEFQDIQSLIQLSSVNVPHLALTTVWGIPWTWKHYTVAKDQSGRLLGAGSLLPLDNCLAEIRGLVVEKCHRDAGIASKIVEHMLRRARVLEMNAVCVTRKPSFFRKFGFQETNPAWLEIQQHPKLRRGILEDSVSQPLAPRIAMALAG